MPPWLAWNRDGSGLMRAEQRFHFICKGNVRFVPLARFLPGAQDRLFLRRMTRVGEFAHEAHGP